MIFSRISVFVSKKHSRSILRKMLLECFFDTKTLMREKITAPEGAQFPVGTKVRRGHLVSAPSSYTALWQKAGDQPSYRQPSPFGGCNFLSHKCFFATKTLMRERNTESTRVQFPVGTKVRRGHLVYVASGITSRRTKQLYSTLITRNGVSGERSHRGKGEASL